MDTPRVLKLPPPSSNPDLTSELLPRSCSPLPLCLLPQGFLHGRNWKCDLSVGLCQFGRRSGRRRRSLDVTATPCGKLCVFQWRCCYLQRDAQRDTSTQKVFWGRFTSIEGFLHMGHEVMTYELTASECNICLSVL